MVLIFVTSIELNGGSSTFLIMVESLLVVALTTLATDLYALWMAVPALLSKARRV